MEESKKRVQIKVPPTVRPLFADEVMLSTNVKSTQGGEKEGVVRIAFIDIPRKEVLGEFILNRITAKRFNQILGENLKKLDDIISGKVTIKPKKISTTEEELSYIG